MRGETDTLSLGRVAQTAEHRVDCKPPGMAPVVDAEVEGAIPSPAPLLSVGGASASPDCPRCVGGNYARCARCGWHITPANRVVDGLCSECRTKGAAT